MIPNDFIENLLSRIDITEIISHHVVLKRRGANSFGQCPFHQDKSPSFSVNHQKQFFYCFGCHAAGNALHFLMNHSGKSFIEAVEQLAQIANMEIPQSGQNSTQHSISSHSALLQRFCDYFIKARQQSSQAAEYLATRKIDQDTLDRYQIGYIGADTKVFRQAITLYSQEDIRNSGLYTERSHRLQPLFRQRIMFPIFDTQNRIRGFGGRIITNDSQAPKYLNSPETPCFSKKHLLYGLAQARQQLRNTLTELIVVEGYMDVLALAAHGIHHAVASLGTSFCSEHWHLLQRYSPLVIFCFDGDLAGQKAAEKTLLTILPVLNLKTQAQFVFLPEQHDPDSYVQQYGADGFHALCQQAIPWSTWLVQTLQKKHGQSDLHQQGQFIEAINSALKQIKEPTLHQLLMDEIAPILQQKTRHITPPKTDNITSDFSIDGQIHQLVQYLFALPDIKTKLPLIDVSSPHDYPNACAANTIIIKKNQEPTIEAAALQSLWQGSALSPSTTYERNRASLQHTCALIHHINALIYQHEIDTLLTQAKQAPLSAEMRQTLTELIHKKKQSITKKKASNIDP